MRRRRRYSTQAIGKTKNQTTSAGSIRIQPPPKRSKFWKYLFIFILMAAAGYGIVRYLIPMIPRMQEELNLSAGLEDTTTKAPDLPLEEKAPLQLTPISKKIQVEVLNGCGEQGIAKILTEKLRKAGYDVVNSGNYIDSRRKVNWNVKKTKIIDQLKTTENLINAKDLAELMDVDVNLIESYESRSPIADLTVIIGKDFSQLSVFKKD